MSWFNFCKKKEENPPATNLGTGKAAVAAVAAKKLVVQEEKTPSVISIVTGASEAIVLLRPRVTEKATALAERGVYAFEVTKDATERAVKAAIRALYKVFPVKVAFVPLCSKEIIVKGRKGRTKGGKKAYVYLKKGEKIEVL